MSTNKLKSEAPTFALVKNVSFLQIGEDDLVFEGEVLSTSRNILDLFNKIPKPKADFTNADVKKKFVEVFEDEEISEEDLFFEDHPAQFIQEFEVTDIDLFGESFSIVLACNGDVEATSDFLMGIFVNEILNEKDEAIQDYHLVELWEEYIDRIALIETPEKITEEYSFFTNVIRRVEDKLDELPNAPTDEVWQSFEDAFNFIYENDEE